MRTRLALPLLSLAAALTVTAALAAPPAAATPEADAGPDADPEEASAASDVAPSTKRTVYVFSHAEHLAREGALKCRSCHAPSKDPMGLPEVSKERCQHCHEVVPSKQPRFVQRKLEVDFPHNAHLRTLGCRTCHAINQAGTTTDHLPEATKALKEDTKLVPEWTLQLKPSDCLACHQKQHKGPRPRQCISCHGNDRRREKPVSHDINWTRMHGERAIYLAATEHGQSCQTCHREVGCKRCHQTQAPRDHTALWRVRTHGTAASWDRARCKTCHEVSTCIQCHSTTEPANHGAAWVATHALVAKGRKDASCLACHRSSFCIDCHRGNP